MDQQNQPCEDDVTTLRERLKELYATSPTKEVSTAFLESLNAKALTHEQALSEEFYDIRFVVMRHSLRCRIDYDEAVMRARKENVNFYEWQCVDTAGKTREPVGPRLTPLLQTRLIDNIPAKQYFYVGCEIAFRDSSYPGLGQVTNNTAKMHRIVLDPRDERIIEIEGHIHKLNHPPACIVVSVDNVETFQVHETLPPGCIPLFPKHMSERFSLDDEVEETKPERGNVEHQCSKARSYLRINRYGNSMTYTIARSDYSVQGKTNGKNKLILDLRVPPDLCRVGDFIHRVVVMLTRVRSDDDWALLAPLWCEGDSSLKASNVAEYKRLLKFSADHVAEAAHIRSLEKASLNRYLSEKFPKDEHDSSRDGHDSTSSLRNICQYDD